MGGIGSSNRNIRVTPLTGQIGTTTITVNVSDGVNTTSTSFDLTVARILLSIATVNATQIEGDSGNTPFTFVVTRSGYTGETTIVNYTITGNGANQADASDFGGTLPSGTIGFAPGETSKTITVNATGDTTVEPDKGFKVSLSLSTPSNGIIFTTATAAATIRDDDPAPTLAIAPVDANKYEGDSGNTPFEFVVTRVGNNTRTSSVNFAVTGSGTNPANAADFGGTLPTGTVNFASGQSSQRITINVSGDKTLERNENFTVTLSNPTNNTTITTATATGTILYDDTPNVTLSLSANTLNENGGSAILRATLSEPFFNDTIIQLGLFDGTARRGIDYNVVDTLVIPAGSTTVTTPITTLDDILSEGNERFSIDIVSVVNGVEQGVQRVIGTIIDDDPPDISITATNSQVNEDGTDYLTYTVTRTGEVTDPLTVTYIISGGTAINGVDYSITGNTVVFSAGARTATIIVDPTADRIAEFNETVTLTLVDKPEYKNS